MMTEETGLRIALALERILDRLDRDADVFDEMVKSGKGLSAAPLESVTKENHFHEVPHA